MRERFAGSASDLLLTRVNCRFDYPLGPAQVVEFFRQNHEPTARAFAEVGKVDRATLRRDLVRLWTSHNQSGESARTTVDAEYLEVIAIRA